MNHATACVSGPLLVIVGGWSGQIRGSTISDCWIVDLTTNLWKKVYSVCILDTFKLILYIHSSAIPP